MPSHLLLANPVAGRGLGAKRLKTARHRLDAAGTDYDVHVTQAPNEARTIAREAAERYALVVALGGDGTVQEVAGGLAEARLAAPVPHPAPFAGLGVLPAGTGNDLVKSLGFPGDFDRALDTLLAGRRRDLDLGRVRWRLAGDPVPRERVFVNNVGLGFEAQVAWEAYRSRLPLRGTALYLAALMRALGRLACPVLRLRLPDGREDYGPRLLVSAGNGHTVGAGFRLNPDADPFDGLLDLCVVGPHTRRQVLRLFPRVLKGAHLSLPGVWTHRARSVDVTGDAPFHAHADGEPLGADVTHIHLEILPGLLPVVC